MLQNAKYIYALSMWTVEKRPAGWYFSKSAYHGDKHDWRGPYSSEMSVSLMIARELLREITIADMSLQSSASVYARSRHKLGVSLGPNKAARYRNVVIRTGVAAISEPHVW